MSDVTTGNDWIQLMSMLDAAFAEKHIERPFLRLDMSSEEFNDRMNIVLSTARKYEREQIAAAANTASTPNDPVNHPKHYTSHPSGIECVQVTEHMGFNIGNAVKYLWRADLKNDAAEDLRKAKWYIERELLKRGVK